eukprot:TRINITY_DN6564_c0_g1_i3.p1 TRINITY_DN6564_c0_g1~~TRINITY_DN6564_c0_g1_i3.p1  ORF type:complete len:1454 (+),score=154.48 TRINITY_DN6564_c0_g1_i3:110-4363(+)
MSTVISVLPNSSANTHVWDDIPSNPHIIKSGVTHNGSSASNVIYSMGNTSHGQTGAKFTWTNWVYKPSMVEWPSNLELSQVVAGDNSSFAITRAGDLYAWGDGSEGQLGNGECGKLILPRLIAQNVSRVSTCRNRTVAVRNDGAIMSWGSGQGDLLGHGQEENLIFPRLISFLNSSSILVTEVSCGFNHTFCVTSDGSLYGWGKNTHYCIKHSAGDEHYNTTDVIRYPTVVAIYSEGNEKLPIRFRGVGCGRSHTLALSVDGEVYGFGSNSCGQVGVVEDNKGSVGAQVVKFPRKVNFPHTGQVERISVAHLHSAAIIDGELFTWGCGTSGQLGLGPIIYAMQPTKVEEIDKVVSVSCAEKITTFITRNGTVFIMGTIAPSLAEDTDDIDYDCIEDKIQLPDCAKLFYYHQMRPQPIPQDYYPNSNINQVSCGSMHLLFASCQPPYQPSYSEKGIKVNFRTPGYYTLECKLMRRSALLTRRSVSNATNRTSARLSQLENMSAVVVEGDRDRTTVEDIRVILIHEKQPWSQILHEVCRAYKKRMRFQSPSVTGKPSDNLHVIFESINDFIIKENILVLPRRNLHSSSILQIVSDNQSIRRKSTWSSMIAPAENDSINHLLENTRLSSTNKRHQGHTKPVTCMVADETHIYTGSADGFVRGWNKNHFILSIYHPCEKVFEGHSDAITELVLVSIDRFASNLGGKMLCSASCDNTVKIWDIEHEECIETVQHFSKVLQMAVTQLGLLLTGCEDGTVHVFDFHNVKTKYKITPPAPSPITCMIVDLEHVYFGRVDGNIIAYAHTSLRKTDSSAEAFFFEIPDMADPRPHNAAVSCMFETPQYLFSGGHDNEIKIWNKATRKLIELRHNTANHERLITSITFLPHNNLLITTSWDGRVYLRTLQFQDGVASVLQPVHALYDHLSVTDFDTFRPQGFAKYHDDWLFVSCDQQSIQHSANLPKIGDCGYLTYVYDMKDWAPTCEESLDERLRYKLSGHMDIVTNIHVERNLVYTASNDGQAISFRVDLTSKRSRRKPLRIYHHQLYSSFIARMRYQHIPWAMNLMSIFVLLFDFFNMITFPIYSKSKYLTDSITLKYIFEIFTINNAEAVPFLYFFFFTTATLFVLSFFFIGRVVFEAERYENSVQIRNIPITILFLILVFAYIFGSALYVSSIARLLRVTMEEYFEALDIGSWKGVEWITMTSAAIFLVVMYSIAIIRIQGLNTNITRANYLEYERRSNGNIKPVTWRRQLQSFFFFTDDVPEHLNVDLFSKKHYKFDQCYAFAKIMAVVASFFLVEIKIIAAILLGVVTVFFIYFQWNSPFYSPAATLIRSVLMFDLMYSYVFIIINGDYYVEPNGLTYYFLGLLAATVVSILGIKLYRKHTYRKLVAVPNLSPAGEESTNRSHHTDQARRTRIVRQSLIQD